MTREEVIMKEVEECFEYFDKDGYDEDFLSTTSAEKITDLIINHEQDTLKEFVEWQAKQYKDLYYMYDEEIDNKKDCISYLWWCLGRRAGIGEITQLLKMAIEKFLEEKENVE